MLRIATDLSAYALAAGEPFLFEVQLQETSGAVTDLSARAFQLSFYGAGRTLIEKIDPELLVDATGQFLRFARDGRFSDGLFGQQISVELAERYRNGRNVLAVGAMTIAASSAGVTTFDNGVVGQFVVRATLKANASQPGVLTPTMQILPYQGNLGTPAPAFTTAPSISRSGSRLTGNDGVITNGVAKTREWLLNGAAITGATTGTYDLVGTEAGDIVFRVLAEGAGGTVRVASAPVTVTATPKVTITGTPPTTGQVGQAYSFTPATANGSGAKTFTLSSGTLLGGLSFSTTSGAITGTPTVAGTMSGLVVTVTDNTGSASTASTTVTIAAAAAAPITLVTVGSSTPDYGVTRDGSTADGDDRLTYSTNGTTFQRLNTGAYMQPLGKSLIAATGRPVRVIAKAVGGQSLRNIAADANGYTTGVINAINAAGGADAVWLQAGYNDIGSGVPASKAVPLGDIRNAISRIRTGTNLPNLMFFIGITQDRQNSPELRYQREAEMTVILNDPNVRFLVNQTDLETSDTTHMTVAAQVIAAPRAALALNAYFTGTTQKRGPRVVSASAVTSTTTDVTFAHSNGTDFSPTTGAVGFSVYDGNGARLTGTVTADRVSSTVMRVTHPAGAVSLEFGTEPLTNTADAAMLKDNGAVPLPAEPSQAFVAISGAISQPLAITGTPSSATVGTPYSYKPAATGGSGTKTFARSGTALPAGLSLNAGTGEISGTPTTAATSSGIVLTVTDSSGSASQTISIVVASAGAAPSFSDTFTDTDGKNLTAHTSDSGHTWTSGTGAFTMGSGRVFTTAAPSNATSSWTPNSEAYTVDFTIDVLSLVQHNTLVRFRIAGETSYYYAGVLFQGGMNAVIGHTINGAVVNVAVSPQNYTVGQQLNFTLIVPAIGGTIRLLLNGAEILTLADTRNELSAKGSIGIRQSLASISATTGYQMTSISATNA